jgi:hypothetical protein
MDIGSPAYVPSVGVVGATPANSNAPPSDPKPGEGVSPGFPLEHPPSPRGGSAPVRPIDQDNPYAQPIDERNPYGEEQARPIDEQNPYGTTGPVIPKPIDE